MSNGNQHPISFRLGLSLTKALNEKSRALNISRNFLVYALIKAFLCGVTVSDDDLKMLWFKRSGRLDTDIQFQTEKPQ